MAGSYNNASMFRNSVLLISLLLIINMAECRLSQFGSGKAKLLTVNCDGIYAQQDGDTCTSISQVFRLDLDSFLLLNPNLDCDSIFIGEWLCVLGTVN